MHIPKTAGTTFRNILQNNFPSRPPLYLYDNESADQFHTFALQRKCLWDLIAGHLPFNYLQDLASLFSLISFIRDPLSRMMSLYNFMMTDNSHPLMLQMQAQEWSFERYLKESDDNRCNMQVTYFAGTYRNAEHEDMGQDLLLAQRNLSAFEFVGIVEEFDLSLLYLRHKYSWDVRYQKMQVTKDRRIHDITPAQRNILHRRCWADYALYCFAMQRFIRQISSQLGLDEIVRKFHTEEGN